MVKNPHYLYRMTVLGAVAALAGYVKPDVLKGTMLPVVVQCAKDKVGGGRLVACACLFARRWFGLLVHTEGWLVVFAGGTPQSPTDLS
jgi:hypothetical protein